MAAVDKWLVDLVLPNRDSFSRCMPLATCHLSPIRVPLALAPND